MPLMCYMTRKEKALRTVKRVLILQMELLGQMLHEVSFQIDILKFYKFPGVGILV